MIFDKENLFLDKAAITNYGTAAKYSDVVVNEGGGNAYDPPFLAFCVTGAATAGGALTVVVQTSDTEAFTTATDLVTHVIPVGAQGPVLQARMPYGLKKYMRLKLTGAAAMTGNAVITSGLVTDIDLPLA